MHNPKEKIKSPPKHKMADFDCSIGVLAFASYRLDRGMQAFLSQTLYFSQRDVVESNKCYIMIKTCSLPVENKPPPPQNEEQLLFDF